MGKTNSRTPPPPTRRLKLFWNFLTFTYLPKHFDQFCSNRNAEIKIETNINRRPKLPWILDSSPRIHPTLPQEKYQLLRNIHTKNVHMRHLVQVTHTWQPYNTSIHKPQKAEETPFNHTWAGVSCGKSIGSIHLAGGWTHTHSDWTGRSNKHTCFKIKVWEI